MGLLSKIIAGLPRPLLIIFISISIIVICVVDYFFEPRVSFILFYLFPIFLATWYIGDKAGIAISAVCAGGWAISDFMSFHIFSHPVVPFWNMTATFCVFLVVALTLGRLKRSLLHEKELARTDALTAIANRRAFFEIAGNELSRMNRYKRPFTIAYLDLDDFKLVNDRLGHEAGDDLLRFVSIAIRSTIRSSDLIARVGGDEFAILLPETNEEQARSVIEKINTSLHETLKTHDLNTTYSIGVVTYVRPPATVDDMLKKADHMMYAAKREGKNGTRYLVWKESAIAQ
jgi:diguanylate cyclase (GGDEF)-like protein